MVKMLDPRRMASSDLALRSRQEGREGWHARLIRELNHQEWNIRTSRRMDTERAELHCRVLERGVRYRYHVQMVFCPHKKQLGRNETYRASSVTFLTLCLRTTTSAYKHGYAERDQGPVLDGFLHETYRSSHQVMCLVVLSPCEYQK
jgi:hypothetical protein